MTTHLLDKFPEAAPRARLPALPVWRQPLLAVAVAMLVFLTMHAATVMETVSIWGSTRAYRFSWLVVPIALYLLWQNRSQYNAIIPTGSLLGPALAVASCLLWICGELANIGLLRQTALLLGVFAVVLAATGRPLFLALAPTLMLLVFLVPMGDIFTTTLKHTVISFTHGFTAITGLPFTQDGFTFFVGAHDYTVIDACAGLAYFLSGWFLGLTFALLIYRSWWKIIALTALGASLGILANCLRISGIVLYDHLSGSQMSVPDHVYFEIPAALFCLFVLLYVFSRLNTEFRTDSAALFNEDVPQPGLTNKSLLCLLCALVLVSIAPIATPGLPAASGNTAPLALPEALGDWHMQSNESQWKPQISDKNTLQATVSYAMGDRTLVAFVAQPTSSQGKISAGSLRLNGDGEWIIGATNNVELCGSSVCFSAKKYTLRLREGGTAVRYVYATYALDAELYGSATRLRAQRAWNRWRGVASQPRLVAVMHDDTQALDSAELANLLTGLAATGTAG